MTVDVERLNRRDLELLDAQVKSRLEMFRVVDGTKDEIISLVSRLLDFTGRDRGQEWVPPRSPVDAYPQGWVVSFNERAWESRADFNMSTPGGADWVELT